ncbi:hypothetical protein SmJEL517_g02973 [Synchytrium microbalum]|uniref:ATP synthase subunit 4 n=1 Tax=Synchytrium microbalum TaxID=1806994 RepID=A0A507C4S9_9FUNG|nr:uncharacterized protein SmJEL517_g02973 [Synchytrium microbalum]TPX34398.1 hypothetical protein SmJEL517_g02973 [Synchytrium microbalum]
MAFRQATNLVSRGKYTSWRPSLVKSALSAHIPAIASTPFMARSMSATRPDPKETASAIISIVPGESMVAKTGTVLLSAAVAAYMVSKEVYIVDAEFYEMLTIFGAYYIWYLGGRDGAIEYFNERKATMKKVLETARHDHKAVVKERIDHISKLSDVVDVTKGLYDMSKDIARLEAETYELKQKVAFSSEVKGMLDSWVRYEASVREAQQRRLVEAVISKIEAGLEDPKVQQSILNQCVSDVESLAKSARA